MLCLISDTKKYLFFPPLCHTYFCFPSQADGHVQLVEGRGKHYQFEQIRLPTSSAQLSFVTIQGSHPIGSKNYDLLRPPETFRAGSR